MRLAILLFLGVLGSVVSVSAIGGSILVQARGGRDKLLASVGGLLAALIWALFGFGAMNITQPTSCCVITTTNRPLAILGAVMAGLMIMVALFGTLSLVDVGDVSEVGARR